MEHAIDPIAVAQPSAAQEDYTHAALAFVHGLLQSPPGEGVTLADLLRDLASAFGADGAGVASPLESPLVVQRVRGTGSSPGTSLPWAERTEFLRQVCLAAAAVPVRGGGASWLLASVYPPAGGDWLLWLEASAARTWTCGETAALPLAGQALARLTTALAGSSTAWPRPLERARVQQHVENAARVAGRLAHDFGNVLTGILGFSELTLNHLPADSLPYRYVQEVRQSAQQGAEWIQKLQLFSRRRAGAFVPASVSAVAAQEEARVRRLWGSQVTIQAALPADLPPVALEAGALRQALAQVLDNAHEAIAGEGVVTLTARLADLSGDDCLELLGSAAPGRHVELTVTDTGPGLSAELRGRLFTDMFHSTKVRRRGLGLAMVYGVLQSFRGGLRFGPDPAQGTAVRLFLPVAQMPPAGDPHASVKARARVLAVDDDPLVLRYIATVLESAGYRVQVAPGGAEALALYKGAAEPFALVLSDVVMPQMNGVELAQRLRQFDPGVNLLFLSSEVPEAPRIEGVDRPAFLPKPFRAEALLRAVAEAIERRHGAALVGRAP